MARRSINLISKAERIWQWIFPTLVLAVAPLVAQYLLVFFNWGLTDYSFDDFAYNISPHGELLLIAVVLVAESVSETWRRQITGWQKDFIGTLCLGFIIIASVIFAGLTVTHNNATVISSHSFRFFLVGIILCITCKLVGRS